MAATKIKPISRAETVLPPVRPNAGIEADYRRRLQCLVREMAESMLLHIRAVYRDLDPAVGFARDADPIVLLKRALKKWGERWTDKLSAASEEIAGLFARKVRRDVHRRMATVLRDAGFTVRFRPTEAMTQAYRLTVASNVNLIKSIPAQFLKDVQTTVWQSVMKGYDLAALSKDLQKNYGVSHRRAALIARDQAAKAHAVMEETQRAELGITEAVWVHSGGGKEPRPEHVKWGDQKKRYDIAQGMWSEVDQEFVWPGTPINCKCVSRSIISGVTD